MIDIFKEEIYPRYKELIQFSLNLALKTKLPSSEHKQIILQSPRAAAAAAATTQDWFEGTGKSKGQDEQWEKEFKYLHPQLENTVIEDYLNWLEIPVYRTRIMLSTPKSTYTIHKDHTARLHLPLITHKDCKFLFTDPLQLTHLPANGQTYWVDTRKEHTFINCSLMHRYHLVMIV